MILNHPLVSFEGFGVIFEKEIETSQFDMGFNKITTLGRITSDFIHFLNRLSPSLILDEEKSNMELCFFRPFAVRIKLDQFSIGLYGFLFHSFFLVVIPQLHQGLTGEGVLGISFW